MSKDKNQAKPKQENVEEKERTEEEAMSDFIRKVESRMGYRCQLQSYPYRLTYCPVDTDTTGPRCYDA